MKTVRVLIADDSVVYRTQIKAALSVISGVEIVGVASNGKIALERLQTLEVDLLILDLEMPEMDGIATLKEMLKRGIKCKTIIFASVSKRGAERTLEALRLGACDFIAKPGHSDDASVPVDVNPSKRIQELLEPKVQELFSLRVWEEGNDVPHDSNIFPKVIIELFEPEIVVIGSSTGGPTVLETLFSQITLPLRCPIVIAQHMPPVFTESFAARLEKLSGIPTAEATHNTVLLANHVYIAPGNFHLSLTGTKEETRLMLDQNAPVNFVRPAVDPLFASAAAIFKEKCLGIILTGMGHDGAAGAVAIKRNGGCVYIQSEKTCVVFGMPGAVMALGAYDKVLSPAEITCELQDKVSEKNDSRVRAAGKAY